MSVTVPLALRLKGNSRDHHVTRHLRDLAFSASVPGGFGPASFALDRPLNIAHDDLDAYTRVFIYDRRTGAVAWEGHLEDPGRGAGPDGQVFNLTAVGGGSHTLDRTEPYVYVDQIDYGQLQRAGSSKRAGDAGEDVDSGTGEPGFRLGLLNGYTAATNDEVSVLYQHLRETGQTLARFSYSWDAGRTSADWRLRAKMYPSGTVARDDAFSTAGGASSARKAPGDYPVSDNYLKFMIQYTGGGGQIAVDTTWAVIKDPYIIGSRLDADGTDLPTADYTKATVDDNNVVRDLLGRLLPLFDGENASIAAGVFEIDHMVYIDGASAAKILEDLMLLVRRYWAVWESDPVTGLYSFEWLSYPSTVRFEASAKDGFDSPASTLDLYNRVRVRYKDRKGRIRYVTRTQTVAVLDAAGVTRTYHLDISDELGSLANANQAGDVFLAEHAYPPNAGTLTVNRPIFDAGQGRMLQPWELVRHAPGQLIRVGDVAPHLDALNLTDRDGVTVFRCVGANYTPSAGAVLDLDSTPRRIGSIIARQRKDFARARRR